MRNSLEAGRRASKRSDLLCTGVCSKVNSAAAKTIGVHADSSAMLIPRHLHSLEATSQTVGIYINDRLFLIAIAFGTFPADLSGIFDNMLLTCLISNDPTGIQILQQLRYIGVEVGVCNVECHKTIFTMMLTSASW